jgi:hypothetical protein
LRFLSFANRERVKTPTLESIEVEEKP